MTATWKGLTVPDLLWDTIIGGAYGNVSHQQVPPALLLAISNEETRNPNNPTGEPFRNIQSENTNVAEQYRAENGREASWSYWQVLNQGGIGDGYTAEQLLIPATARFIVVNHILTRIRRGATLRQAISAWSTAEAAWQAYLANPIVDVSGF